MNLKELTISIISRFGSGIISEERFINILQDYGYFKEYPQHRYALMIMIKTGTFNHLWESCIDSNMAKLETDGRMFIEKTQFKEKVISEILSTLSGCPILNSLSEPRWHPALVWHPDLSDNKKHLEGYVLHMLQFSFLKGTLVKKVNCWVNTLNHFTIVISFAKFEHININDYQERGDFITNDSTRVEICLRNGEYISGFDTDNYSTRTQIELEWDHPDWATGEWTDEGFVMTNTEPILRIKIKIPICDIYKITVGYPS